MRRGLGAAFRLGFDAVPHGADAVVTMDADLNHQPEELARLLDSFEAENADIAIGSRKVPGAEILQRGRLAQMVERLGQLAAPPPLRADVRDANSGYRVYRASALRHLHFRNNGYAFQGEIVLLALAKRRRVIEVQITFTRRRQGQSGRNQPLLSEAPCQPLV
jgi:dolichol-phosphate mannosyltransferase